MATNIDTLIPKELLNPSRVVINALKNSHRARGLNISQLSKETKLNKYTLNKILGALETVRIVEYEIQGTSKVYYLIGEIE